MAELKTKKTEDSVSEFVAAIPDEKKRTDSQTLLEVIEKATGETPKMWGTIVGFGDYHYKYASGREGDWFLAGFAPRKQNLPVYVMAGFDAYDGLMAKLGNYKTGKSCLYIKKVEDVDLDVLEELVRRSAEHVRATNA